MTSNSLRTTIAALATTTLLALPSASPASADKDYSLNGVTGDFAHGPLPPPGPVKDYSKNAATGDYSGWPPAEAPTEPVSASPVEAVTVAEPDGFIDWSDAAIGAGVGLVVALIGGGATVTLARRRIASPTTGGLGRLTRTRPDER